MKKIVVFAFACLSSLSYAQNQISGVIVDEHHEPVAFASVALIQESDSVFICGVTSDEDGTFSLDYDYSGKLLRVSYVGYTTQYQKPSQDMRIILNPETMTISGVVITGSRPAYKMKNGVLVAPVENTVLSQLGDANDVLAQLPLVTGDNDNFRVLGRGKTAIYINNRLIRDSQELSEIKSNSIKDIKVETNPGSKYAAEVGAVIRIVTLKPVGEGLGGEVISRYDRKTKNQHYETVRLNYRHQGLDLFFNGTYGYYAYEDDQTSNHNFMFGGTPIHANTDDKIGNENYQYANLTGGFNYSISSKQLLGVRYNFSKIFPYDTYMKSIGSYTAGSKTSEYKGISNKEERNKGSHHVDAYYQNEFSEKWQLNVDVTYLGRETATDGYQREWMDGLPSEVKNESLQKPRLWAMKVVNTNQLLGGVVEWGAEITDTRTEQTYQMFNEEVAQYIPNTTTLSKQKSQSVFTEYSHQFGLLAATVGLRYEHVDFDSEINHKYNSGASRIYNNLFPSFSLSYNSDQFNLSFGYRTIVQRPSYYELRGEVQYNSSYSAEGGNPGLQPTYDNCLSFMVEHRNLVIDASYDYLNDACLFYNRVMSEHPMTLASYMNHDMQTYHVNLIYSPTIGVWKPSFLIGTEGQVLHDNSQSFSGSALTYQWKNIWSLPGMWTITFNLDGHSARWQQFTYEKPLFSANMSVRKDIGNWQLRVGVLDIFNTSRERWRMDTYGTRFEKWNNPHNHGVYIRVQYSFNPAKSKYKGGQAGQSEMNRL